MRSKYVGTYQLISERIRKLTGDHPTIIIADTSDTLSDIIDQAERDMNHHLTISLREKDVVELHALRTALERIENGTFGICESCGNDIPPKRLEIKPESPLCVQCQTVEERQNGHLKVFRTDNEKLVYRLRDIAL